MPPQHTRPDTVEQTLSHWRALANSADPLEARTGQHLLQAWRTARAADAGLPDGEDRPPAAWAHALADLISDDEQHWSDATHFKTGHSLAHASKSGTCLWVNTEWGWWGCRSCLRKGTAVDWLVQHQGLTHGQAWWALRRKYGDPHGR